MESWIRFIARWKWLIVGLWCVAVLVTFFVLPNLQKIIMQTEISFIPEEAESEQALKMLKQLDLDQQAKSNAIVVMHRTGGMSESDRLWIQQKIKRFSENQGEYNISSVRSAYDDARLVERFRSDDLSTELLVLSLPYASHEYVTQQTVHFIKQQLLDVPSGASVELTGTAPIYVDYTSSSNAGIRKTEWITIFLVIAILLVVFRSPIAPLVSLLTIGTSLIISRGLVALFSQWGMAVSSFTDAFLIAVLFGAGTDYCILLLHRYREELRHSQDRIKALVKTMQTVGKTVLYAGSTVWIAFVCIGFATFGLYQSAVGVSIGVLVTLFAAFSLTPALMLLFGSKLFWPNEQKQSSNVKQSSFWSFLSRLTSKRSLPVLLIFVLLCAPLVMLFEGNRTFDDLAEIDPELSSVKGFRLVEEKFGKGEVLPIIVAMTSTQTMRTREALAKLEQLAQQVSQLADVKEVRSVTRPIGKAIEQLSVSYQWQKSDSGLTQIQQGLEQMQGGLVDGATQLKSNQFSIQELQDSSDQLATQINEVASGLQQLSQGVATSAQAVDQLKQSSLPLQDVTASIQTDLSLLLTQYPDISNHLLVQQIKAKLSSLYAGMTQTQTGLHPLQQSLNLIAPTTDQMATGLKQLANGQQRISSGIGMMNDRITQLTTGLDRSALSLSEAVNGLQQIRSVQSELLSTPIRQETMVSVPQTAWQQAEFQQALDYYMSKDGKTTKFEIILKINPYSAEAMTRVKEIKETIMQALQTNKLTDFQVRLTGATAQIVDLDEISQKDFYQTGGLMLLGIFIILLLLLRSFLLPLCILLSLTLNYAVTMGLVEFVFVTVGGFEGLSWSVSFFVFLILVALGVDYSIFLLARFKEELLSTNGNYKQAMDIAMKSTGGVILSAAWIMSGTFAALVFSGVDTLLMLGTGIVIGLLLYATLFIGLFVPALTHVISRITNRQDELEK